MSDNHAVNRLGEKVECTPGQLTLANPLCEQPS
jgi:hypothetical protein